MNGFFNNLPDLEKIVLDKQPSVIALQEVHKAVPGTMDNTLGKKYKWITKTNRNFYHSVGIGVAAELPFSVIDLNTNLPVVAVRMSWPFPVTIVSVYIPNQNIPDLENQIAQIVEKLPEPMIFLGDSNAHHQAWGSRQTDARGSAILEIAGQIGLSILNDGSPTFMRGRQESAIDISLASTSIVSRINWTAETDPMGSDHVPITILLNDTPPNTTRRPRWVYKKADWDGFRSSINSLLESSPPESIVEITEAIHEAAKANIPKSSANPGRRALPWWSEEIKKTVKARRKALRAAKRLPENHPQKEEVLQKLRNARNVCRQTIREAKEQSWASFLDSINDSQSSAELWSKVNAIQGRRKKNGMALKLGNQTIRDPGQIADLLADHFFNLSSLQKYPKPFLKRHPDAATAITSFTVALDASETYNHPFSTKD